MGTMAKALRRGDRVRVVAPSGRFHRKRFESGVAWLRQRYDVVFGDEVFDAHRYAAGRPDRRQQGLLQALADDAARAIFCARGGYGAMHLLPQLDVGAHSPKVLVGFSDITALHAAWQAAGQPSVHGPVVTQLGEIADAARQRLVALLEEPHAPPPLRGSVTYVKGAAHGPLVGGNLAVLAALVGTPYLPPVDGAILVLEDVGERPYRIDRMWTQLRFAGVFERAAGIVLGGFTRCDEPGGDHTADEVLRELALETGLPCAAGFPIGHDDVNVPIPLGVEAELDAGSATVRFSAGIVC